MILFILRQLCQAVSALPIPEGMIWRSPGVPSLLVTYGVANDLFFSGHTALAVFGATELGLWGGPAWAIVGGVIALFEVAAVLVLRAHFTMDVYAGAVTSVVATWASFAVGPTVDEWMSRLASAIAPIG
jgi:membrane-associated phospholipid phosphatase